MKILHVISSPRAEGTPKIVLDWLNAKVNIDQELLFLDAKGDLNSIFRSLPNWQYYNDSFILGIKSIPKIIALVKRVAKDRNPDLIICWNAGFSPWVALGAWKGGCKRIISHAGNYPGTNSNWKTVLHTNISGWAHKILKGKIVCCSEYVMKAYKNILFSPTSIYSFSFNCFSLKSFQNEIDWENKEQDFIMVATLEKHKDHITLLKGWKILEEKGYKPSLYIVGGGTQRSSLESLKDDLGLPNVEFLGSINDVTSLLGNAKYFVFSTTREEGFGTVLLEALASGCHLIASEVPACQEVLQNGKWGLTFEPGSPEKLAEAIISCLSGKYAFPTPNETIKYLEDFSPERMIRNYLSVYDLG